MQQPGGVHLERMILWRNTGSVDFLFTAVELGRNHMSSSDLARADSFTSAGTLIVVSEALDVDEVGTALAGGLAAPRGCWATPTSLTSKYVHVMLAFTRSES